MTRSVPPHSSPASHDEVRPRVWTGVFAPPMAWFVALTGGYFMVPWACGSRAGGLALHVTCLVMLAAAASAGALAFDAWRRDPAVPAASGHPADRSRFLALLGTFSGVLFSLIILVQWLAVVFLNPCEPGPRLPLSPRALLLLASGGWA